MRSDYDYDYDDYYNKIILKIVIVIVIVIVTCISAFICVDPTASSTLLLVKVQRVPARRAGSAFISVGSNSITNMQLHHLKRPNHIKNKKRVGRGGKRGRYCGRGIKGQKARAGAKIRPHIRDFIKSIPKLRGVKFKSRKEKPQVVNLKDIDSKFEDNKQIVSPQSLEEKGLISDAKKKVKILGMGKITKSLTFKEVDFSESAKKKIKKAGGKIEG